jgi:hypothetical protein
MGFSLIVEDTLYRKDISTTGGSWVDGVYYKGNETISYTEFSGLTEAFQKGITSMSLPEGVSNEEMLYLYTSTSLKTHKSLAQESNLADIVYLVDPEVDGSAEAYTVWDKAPHDLNQGFSLIDGNCSEFILIRENRV